MIRPDHGKQINLMLVIGITGGIGSGKSTVTDRLQQLGAKVIDADRVAHELSRPGAAGFEAMVAEFGEDILDAQGEIDRARLRQRVFDDPGQRIRLENLLHPLIRAEMRRRMAQIDDDVCFLAIPLLIETGQTDLIDRLLVIDARAELRLQRALERDHSDVKSVKQIMAAQIGDKARRAAADDIIENNNDLDTLYRQVDDLYRKYRQMVQQAKLEQNPLRDDEQPAAEAATRQVAYELPLNERVRTLLRLESVFASIRHHLSGDDAEDSRAVLQDILDLLNVLNRPDIKKELIKELDRIQGVMKRYLEAPGVDRGRVGTINHAIESVQRKLQAMNGQMGQKLRTNEFVMAVKQKESVPGGPTIMDLPGLGHWLSRGADARRHDLLDWLEEFRGLEEAVSLILELIRSSTPPTSQQASKGFYQNSLDTGLSVQMIRVLLPANSAYCPEISGGRHRFTVRFLQPEGIARPTQTDQNVTFELACCVL